jgi:hypothetical protein
MPYLSDQPDALAPSTVAEARNLVRQLTLARGHDWYRPWISLAWIGAAAVPYFEEAYPVTARAEGRVRLVFFSLEYAAKSDAAFRLGVAATYDRGTMVRYRACMLLAYSQRKDAIPHLRRLLDHADLRTVEDARAAIKAIDRRQTGAFLGRG